MKEKIEKALKTCHRIKAMLDEIPRELWDIFLPDSVDDIKFMEKSIRKFKTREAERKKVISLQQTNGLPLRPNNSLRETKIKIRIKALKKGKKKNRFRDKREDKDW